MWRDGGGGGGDARVAAGAARPRRRPAVSAALWLLLAGLLSLCALHLVQDLSRDWLIWALATTPWSLLVSVPLLLAGVATRRRLLALLCLAPLACWGVWALPELWPVASTGAHRPPVLRLFDANISQSNHQPREIAGEIRRDHPTVVTLEEMTPQALAYLRHSGVLAGYRWHIADPRPGPAGEGLWSKVPLTGPLTWDNETQAEIGATLHPAGGPAIHVAVVHEYAPSGSHYAPLVWRTQLAAIRQHLAHMARPLLVAGDFNATSDMRPFQRILRLGLSDTAVERGDGWEMTWPNNVRPLPCFFRIDHVLVSRQLVPASYRLGDGGGSDHRSLLVSIAYR